jgi:hypothetical protein
MKSKSLGQTLVLAKILSVVFGFSAANVEAEQADKGNLAARASKLVEERDALGTELLAVLNNESAPDDQRAQAAELLGKLRYEPAIPMLIRYIDVMPSVTLSGGPPAAMALRELGDAAIPRVIEAYLQETNDGSRRANRREYAFRIATGGARNVQTARLYVKGLAAETTTPDVKRRIEEFLRFRYEK